MHGVVECISFANMKWPWPIVLVASWNLGTSKSFALRYDLWKWMLIIIQWWLKSIYVADFCHTLFCPYHRGCYVIISILACAIIAGVLCGFLVPKSVLLSVDDVVTADVWLNKTTSEMKLQLQVNSLFFCLCYIIKSFWYCVNINKTAVLY